MPELDELARLCAAYVDREDEFQRGARVLQSMWRERHGYPIGDSNGEPLGSRLPTSFAKDKLANYLTETVRDVVRQEVLDPVRSKGKLYGKPRIFDNLLSSQPLCFNLFGELQQDLELATAVFRDLAPDRVHHVDRIAFEHSPGRGDRKYLGDSTAFDAFLECTTPAGGAGFIGIEVKYHENLRDNPSKHHDRYDEVAAAMACFVPSRLRLLRGKPLQQIWRDHMLAGSLIEAGDGYEDGLFVLLYPQGNSYCCRALDGYRTCLANEQTFAAWTLESFVAALKRHTKSEWVDQLYGRYLDFERLRYPHPSATGQQP